METRVEIRDVKEGDYYIALRVLIPSGKWGELYSKIILLEKSGIVSFGLEQLTVGANIFVETDKPIDTGVKVFRVYLPNEEGIIYTNHS